MNILKSILIYIFLPICSSIFSVIVLDYMLVRNNGVQQNETTLNFEREYLTKYSNVTDIYSSVYCRGNNHTDRLCFFRNLCYEPNSKLFVFFHSSKSVKTGLPLDRFSPTLTDFSSVADHNTQYFNFVELPESSVSKFNISFQYGHGIIFKRFNPDNLMHVFHDDLLPVFTTLNELSYFNINIDDTEIFLVLADNRLPGPYADLYEGLLIKKPIYLHLLSKEYLHCFRSVYIGLNKQSTWYQYGFKEPQGGIRKSYDQIYPIILNFRDYFVKRFSLYYQPRKESAILLKRNRNRKILNENEVLHSVANNTGLETHIISLEEYSVLQIILQILHCRLLIGMHGSLLILSLFLPPYSAVVELFPFGVNSSITTPYKVLSEIPGLHLVYHAWENIRADNSIPHPEYPPEFGGIRHLPLEEQVEIQRSIVKPFLCCDNPIWLYRIYQDTIVDLDSFGAIVHYSYGQLTKLSNNGEPENFYLQPSEVQNISCTISAENGTFYTFSWEPPWNLQFMNGVDPEYELWIQDMLVNNVQAFLMRKRQFKYLVNSTKKIYYVWIRCYVSNLIGPFNSNPFICLL